MLGMLAIGFAITRPRDSAASAGLPLLALGRAHDLLMQVRWASSSIVNTVRRAIEPYDDEGAGRFSVSGPDVGITSSAVIALAMTLNELCTNTTKFGALSLSTGRVEIEWTIDDKSQRLQLYGRKRAALWLRLLPGEASVPVS
jgi:two-component sensor histidine kinase